MQIGRMDRQATLQSRSLGSPSARGEKEQTFSTLATIWVRRRDVSGREFVTAGQPHAEATSVFEAHFRSDMTTIHRLICEGVTYDVLHVAELGRRAGMQLVCRRLS